MIGTSPFAKQISRQIRKLANTKDILIIGEPGTGKRKLAHEIHQQRAKSGTYILLDGRSTTHAEIQAVLFGKSRDLAYSLTGHDPAKLSNHATLCIANIDALGLLRFRAFRTKMGGKLRDGFGYIQTIYGRRNSYGPESRTREYCPRDQATDTEEVFQ